MVWNIVLVICQWLFSFFILWSYPYWWVTAVPLLNYLILAINQWDSLAYRRPTFRFFNVALHPQYCIPWFPTLYTIVTRLICSSLRICYLVTSQRKTTVITKTISFIILGFDLANLILVLLLRRYISSVQRLFGFDRVSIPLHKKTAPIFYRFKIVYILILKVKCWKLNLGGGGGGERRDKILVLCG